MSNDNDYSETRECVCGNQFDVDVRYAKPWTVCRDCMLEGTGLILERGMER